MELYNPVYPGFVLFCRIGGCIMVAPGFSSERVPVQVRLYLAGAITLALTPPLIERFHIAVSLAEPPRLIATIIAELVIGIILGLLARFYFFALETLSTSVAMTFGLGNIFGSAVTEPEPTPALSSLIVICALTIVFCADLHLEIIRALYLSYETAPIFSVPGPESLLQEITRVLTQAHLLALRICSPFLLFGLIINVALGLLARLTPQVQIYFISGPLVVFLGMSSFFLLGWDFFAAFSSNFAAWLSRG